ncbi:50S ribosomal protein L21 [Brucella anthropi]|uniref:50S ribosomal protein L21 n=1 Tax=Brucella anthropi TaxID=529 RepID=UPI0039877582
MPLLIVQLAVLVAIAFVIGCLLGRLLRRRSASMPDRERTIIAAAHATLPVDEKLEEVKPVKTTETVAASSASAPAGEAKQPEVPATVPDAEMVGDWPLSADQPETDGDPVRDPGRPALLEGPRLEKPDDLTAIQGIGGAVQGLLNGLGIFHYDQIAHWNDDESRWVERNIGFPRRVEREDWIGQAAKLASAASKASARPKKAATKPKTRRTKKTGE